MKQQIMIAALFLIDKNDKTTTLEVKNMLYDAFKADNTFSISQKEVSDAMAELYVENGWERKMNKTMSVWFYEYSLPADKKSKIHTGQLGNIGFGRQNQNIPPTTINTVTMNSKISVLDSRNGEVVAYVSGKPQKNVQSFDKKTARRLCFNLFNDEEIGLTYDNINLCYVSYFNRNKTK